jgi:hypothetical protein
MLAKHLLSIKQSLLQNPPVGRNATEVSAFGIHRMSMSMGFGMLLQEQRSKGRYPKAHIASKPKSCNNAEDKIILSVIEEMC